MTRIRISTHRNNRTIGIVTIADDLNERQIAEIANEAGGMSDLVALGESDLPAGYEWTGDEEYEVIDRREGIANARLISAAPELLTALKDLLAWANISDDPGRASDQAACVARNARAAIAKAEGT